MYIYTWHIHICSIGMYFTSTSSVLNPGIDTDTKYWYQCIPSENTLVFVVYRPRSLDTTAPLFLPSISSAFFVFLWCLFLFCESSAEHLSLIDALDQLRNSHCALAGAPLWTCGCWVTLWLGASVGLWSVVWIINLTVLWYNVILSQEWVEGSRLWGSFDC